MKNRLAHGWGGINRGTAKHTIAPVSVAQLQQEFTAGKQSVYLGRGLGRSYGDSALNSGGTLIDCRFLDHFLTFDAERGILECEAGVTIDDINQHFTHRGWMLPVTPGTQFVTIGGAIANDVHGKNHVRAGSFGAHVISLKLVRSSGEVLDCSADSNSALLAATIGGLGLTGVIVSAKLQLRPIRSLTMNTESMPFENLTELFSLESAHRSSWEYHVAWMDPSTGGRTGCLTVANHVDQSGSLAWPRPRRFPPTLLHVLATDLPGRWLMKAGNLRYRRYREAGAKQQTVESVLYPLDRIPDWNLWFGRKGFYQYQCVLPESVAEAALEQVLEVIEKSSHEITLAVGKWFGSHSSPGLLSFPLPGYSAAFDFANKGAETLRLLDSLDTLIADFNGRTYPAKDGRMPAPRFAAGYPELEKFAQFIDPNFASDFYRRMEQSE